MLRRRLANFLSVYVLLGKRLGQKTDMAAGTGPRDTLSKIASDSFIDVGGKFPEKFTVIIAQGLALQNITSVRLRPINQNCCSLKSDSRNMLLVEQSIEIHVPVAPP